MKRLLLYCGMSFMVLSGCSTNPLDTISSSSPNEITVAAWNDNNWQMAYWSEHSIWMEPGYGYGVTCNLSFTTYKTLGKSISITIPGSGYPYPQCSNLSDIDLVSRVIYAEICNVPPKKNNAAAVAQVIKNRMGTSTSARSVVTARYQFSSVADGNSRFKNPALDNDASTWATCTFLAYQVVKRAKLPITEGKYTNIGTRRFFYDIGSGMPFYLSNKTKCSSSNVTSAYYYKSGSTYYPIKTSVKKIGNHCYFNY